MKNALKSDGDCVEIIIDEAKCQEQIVVASPEGRRYLIANTFDRFEQDDYSARSPDQPKEDLKPIGAISFDKTIF